MKPFFLLIPCRACMIETVPETGMFHTAGQLVGIAQRHQGEDPHGLCNQLCPTTVGMSPHQGRGFFAFCLHKCAIQRCISDWLLLKGGSFCSAPQWCLSGRWLPCSCFWWWSDQSSLRVSVWHCWPRLLGLASELASSFQVQVNHFSSVDISDTDLSLCQYFRSPWGLLNSAS